MFLIRIMVYLILGGCLTFLEFFLGHSKVIVGNGGCTNFWQIRWCLDIALKVRFPLLYKLACIKNGIHMGRWDENGWIGFFIFGKKKKKSYWGANKSS